MFADRMHPSFPQLMAALACVYALASAITFLAYAADKRAARRRRRRTPERVLHLLALAGGWPGAWLAQRLLRHKTVKPAFRRVFHLTVVLNVLLLGVLLAVCATV